MRKLPKALKKLFIFRMREGREKERERNIDVKEMPLARP